MTINENEQAHINELINLVEFCAKCLVDNPEKVRVKPLQGEQTLVIELEVEASEKGKIIGKRGRNITAIRTLLTARATKFQIRCVLDFQD